jgi:dolichol-phosphate mannosyltransferase
MGDSPIHGWTSLIVSLNFIGGIIIMSIGIVGVYIQKMFEEMKKRPLYIIDQLLNMEVNNERF